MPKMDGLGLLQAVRTNPATKKAAFIMLTAQGDRALVHQGSGARRQQRAGQALHHRKDESCDRSRIRGTEMITEAAAKRVHIIQGECKVVNDPDVVLATILGSCVAACMRDPVAGVGGMNHFLLPGAVNSLASGGDATRYGVHLMELLINGLLKHGARRERLEAKIFGGAKTIAHFSECRRAERAIRAAVPDGRGYHRGQ